MNYRKVFAYIFIALVVILLGWLIFSRVSKNKAEAEKAKGSGGPPPKLSVNGYIVKTQVIDNAIDAAGTLLASEEVELHPETSGRIVSLNITEGKSVAKGTLLMKLYDADLQAQLTKLNMQKAIAESNEVRQKKLLDISAIGQQEYDLALNQINNIQSDIALVKAQIEKTEIRAPFTGVLGLKNVSMGAYVSPATIVATLQQFNPLKMDFTVPEKYAESLTAGTQLDLTVDGRDKSYKAKVYAIEPKVDETTRSIKVRALLDNSGAQLLPGTFAKVTLPIKSIPNALMVPTQAIIPEARGKKLIVIKDGKPDFRQVKTGERNESYIQITEGVQAGDTVVVTGIMYVKPKSEIRISNIVE
jgi:membrane fusion protein (multidrug efflux system)